MPTERQEAVDKMPWFYALRKVMDDDPIATNAILSGAGFGWYSKDAVRHPLTALQNLMTKINAGKYGLNVENGKIPFSLEGVAKEVPFVREQLFHPAGKLAKGTQYLTKGLGAVFHPMMKGVMVPFYAQPITSGLATIEHNIKNDGATLKHAMLNSPDWYGVPEETIPKSDYNPKVSNKFLEDLGELGAFEVGIRALHDLPKLADASLVNNPKLMPYMPAAKRLAGAALSKPILAPLTFAALTAAIKNDEYEAHPERLYEMADETDDTDGYFFPMPEAPEEGSYEDIVKHMVD